MDIIDKIFSKLQKQKAPASLTAKILAIPEKKQAKSSSWFMRALVPVFMILVVLVGALYYQFFAVHNIAAAFELTVENTDASGISPASVFILKSSKDISAAQIKKIVKMEPEVDFDVQTLGDNRFQITPKLKLAGNTVYQITIAEGAAERDYAWAFQVRAPFAAISTFPRHQATGVPLNSSIEITFNREDLQEVEKYFSITPQVNGRFEIHGPKVVFLPAKPLAEHTIYTVTFKKGLKAENVSEPLDKDITFAFETAQTNYYSSSSFGFSQGLNYFPPTQQPVMQLYDYNISFENAQAELYAFGTKEQFVQSYYQSRNWDWGWAYYYRENSGNIDTKGLNKISSFKPSVIKIDYQTFFNLPDKLSAGYYLLQLKVGDKTRQAWVLINDVSHYYSLTEVNGFVWAYEFEKKQPINNAGVAYYDNTGQRHDLGKTNGDGIAEFKVPAALQENNVYSESYGKPKMIEIQPQGKPATLALVSAGWWYYSSNSGEQSNFWNYLSTDRFTYKLSDTIKVWGIVKGKAQDYKNQKVKIELREGYYYFYDFPLPGFERQDRPLAESEGVISPFDTVSGQLSFAGMKPGTYQVRVLLNDNVVAQTSVEILAYTKPLYQINVTTSKQAIFAGEPVDFNIKAEFYDGTAVGALKLKYNGYYSDQNLTGEVSLNSRGEGKVTIVPQYKKSSYYPISLYLNFSPMLAEEGDINSQTEASVSVYGPKVYLQGSQKYNDNNNFTITGKANYIQLDSSLDTRGNNAPYWDYISSPASGITLNASVERIEHVQIEDGTYYDPINKTSNPKYRYEQKRTIIQNLSGQTASNGEWAFNLNLPKQENVYYIVKIFGVDSSGWEFSTQVWPYYYKNYGQVYNPPNSAAEASKRLIISLGFEGGESEYGRRFSVGEKVEIKTEILEGKEFFNGKTLFYRYGHNGIGRLQIVNGDLLTDTFASDFRPAVSYKAVSFGPYGFVESNTLMAAYKHEDANLNIKITPNKDSYRPGETAKLAVEVKDKDGQTSSGEVNLSVVDEAVFDVLPYYWQQNILESLYQIDYNESRSGASDFTPTELKNGGGAEGGGCFLPGTKILVGKGKYKNIEDVKVGDVVLTLANEKDPKSFAYAIVQGISSHLVNDYLIINGSLKLTQEHKIFASGKWTEAGLIKLGDNLKNENGQDVKVTSIEKVVSPKTLVHNFNVGKYHTYFAGGFFAHNAEKGGGYRSEFLDTAHFSTQSLSGGKANFEVKLPDNVTSWRATVSAFDNGKIFAGQESKQLAATLPFFVDAVISETYLTGDKPVIVARGFGNAYNISGDTSFTLDIDGINFHQTQTVKGGMADFTLPQLPAGNYEIKLKGKQGNMEDGILRKISVVDSYFTKAVSKQATLSQGMKGLTNEAKGYTDVTFIDLGKAKFYYELIWNSYSWGKRADQITAGYLSKKWLKDYFGGKEDAGQLDLSAYHVPNGGLGLFTYGDSELAISAQLADLAPEAVYQPQLINYFNQSRSDIKADLSRISQSLYGLAVLKQPVLTKLQIIKDEPELKLEDKMYIALGLARLGDKEGARKYYNEQIRPKLHFEGGQAWFTDEQDQTKRVKLTALAGAVASSVGQKEDALAVWDYLLGHYPQNELDVLERFMIIRDQLMRPGKTESSFAYEVNGKKTQVKLEKGQAKTLTFSKDELANISFTDISGQPAAVWAMEESQNPDQLTKNPQLNIKRSFWVDGKQVTQVPEGENVLVRLEYQIAKNAIDGAYQIQDFLPSGLKPITNIWQRGLQNPFGPYNPCVQRRGDPFFVQGNKVYFSAHHSRDYTGSCGTYTIEYYARAATKGEFNVNPALIQSLKNYDSLNVSEKQTLKVISK